MFLWSVASLCFHIPPWWHFIHQLLSSFCVSPLLAITVTQLWYCMMLHFSRSVVNPGVNLDLLFSIFVGCDKCILFPFVEVTGFSNENKVYFAQVKNQKTCTEKWNNLLLTGFIFKLGFVKLCRVIFLFLKSPLWCCNTEGLSQCFWLCLLLLGLRGASGKLVPFCRQPCAGWAHNQVVPGVVRTRVLPVANVLMGTVKSCAGEVRSCKPSAHLHYALDCFAISNNL